MDGSFLWVESFMPKKTSIEQSTETQIAVMVESVGTIKRDVSEIKEKLESHYVTKEEFDPIKKVVYGMVSLILVAVIGALLALVIIR